MPTEETVWIVDDDVAFSDGLSVLLKSLGLTPKTFTSADQFLQIFDPIQPGCIIVDVCLPDIDGLTLLERLSLESLHPPVIMMTSYPEVSTAVRAMQKGAVEYLPKTCRQSDLHQAIVNAFTHDTQRRAEEIQRTNCESALAQLSPPEKDVLQLVVEGKPNKSIAKILNISQRAVEDRRARVMRKLGARTVPDLVRFAIQARFSPP